MPANDARADRGSPEAGPRVEAEIGHRAGLGSLLPEQLRQPRDVDGDAARFVFGVSIVVVGGSTDDSPGMGSGKARVRGGGAAVSVVVVR